MMTRIFGLATALFASWLAVSATAAPVAVTVERHGDGWRLLRGGQPYFVKGAGGDASMELLHACGGNSVRTWGSDNLDRVLAQAHSLGMTVTAGIWLGHTDQGFDYHDPAQTARQLASVRAVVTRYRDDPALLVWGLGNEVEQAGRNADDPAVWTAIEEAARAVKQLDPNHPTMTVLAEVGGDKVAQLHKYCPDIDIVGINSYAGCASIGRRYAAAGGTKPYLVTEFGPPGPWERPKTAWGAAEEPTSTEKADWYRRSYEGGIAGQPQCVGSYAFLWGHKDEGTPTWFGMLLPDGSRVAAVDVMQEMWTGKAPGEAAPAIRAVTVGGGATVAPGGTVRARLEMDAAGDRPAVEWALRPDGAQGADAACARAITTSDAGGAVVRMPTVPGAYRLFVTVRDGRGRAATANVPLFVEGS